MPPLFIRTAEHRFPVYGRLPRSTLRTGEKAPQTIGRRRQKSEASMCERNTTNVGRRVVLVLFALSFLPYGFPPESKPNIYKSHTVPEEVIQKRKMNRYLGGDVDMIPFE